MMIGGDDMIDVWTLDLEAAIKDYIDTIESGC